MSPQTSLVAITPAHNEAGHLPELISTILGQTSPPDLWIIVDDASNDATGTIAHAAAAAHAFIRVLDRTRDEGRQLSSKADAVAEGRALADELLPDPTFIASIDADVELPPHALEFLLERFEEDEQLGIAGGIYVQPVGGKLRPAFTAPHHVPGALQVFRRQVFDDVGGYRALPHGGLDVLCTANARMLGWRTRAFSEVVITHNRRTGTGGGRHPVSAEYHKGMQDYSLGGTAVFELAKCARRVPDRPVVLAAAARLAGYFGMALRRRPRAVPDDLAAFIADEQRQRLPWSRAGTS